MQETGTDGQKPGQRFSCKRNMSRLENQKNLLADIGSEGKNWIRSGSLGKFFLGEKKSENSYDSKCLIIIYYPRRKSKFSQNGEYLHIICS